jgi:predicted transcriptional regulator
MSDLKGRAILVRVQPELKARLDAQKRESRRTYAEEIRMALEQYLDRAEAARKKKGHKR